MQSDVLKIKDKVVIGTKRSVANIVVPHGVTAIGDEAFHHCHLLTSLTIPNSVKRIGNHAFDGCSGLTSLTIPNSVDTIGNYAFQSCSGLTFLTIPNSVDTICNGAFYGCRSLTSVSLPHGLDTVGSRAFGDCKSLTSVVFRPPASRAFIAWAVGNSRHRDNWQLTTLKRLRNVLRLVVMLSVEVRDVSTVDPGGRDYVFRGCTKLIVS